MAHHSHSWGLIWAKTSCSPLVWWCESHFCQTRDLFAIIHVDDIQVMGPNIEKIEKLMKSLRNKYMLISVDVNPFLGIHISNPDKHTLKLSQGQSSRKLLARYGLLENCKSVRGPLERTMEPNSSTILDATENRIQFNNRRTAISNKQYTSGRWIYCK